MPSRSQAQQRSGVFQVKFNETPLILAVEPHMVTSRTNQQVGISVVRAIKVYVVNNFTAFHRATARLAARRQSVTNEERNWSGHPLRRPGA